MIIGAIKIIETDKGVIIEQVALTDQDKATRGEKAMAGVLDVALKTAMEFLAKACDSPTALMIEGKDIESTVDKYLQKHHVDTFRSQLRRAGIKLPPQK